MTIPDRYLSPPRTIRPEASAREAARAMGEAHVGALVVVDEAESPVGVVTDRDLALHVLTNRLDPQRVPVSECMSSPAVILSLQDTLTEASHRMRREGVRRLPVVDVEGRLVGLVAADDLVQLLGVELGQLAAAVRRGLEREGRPAQRTSALGQE